MSQPKNLYHFMGEPDQFFQIIKKVNRLVVADFFATWCGPCKRLGEIIPTIANENPDVVFLKVDVDSAKTLAAQYRIQSVPTIKFFKIDSTGQVQELATVAGDPTAIRSKIKELK